MQARGAEALGREVARALATTPSELPCIEPIGEASPAPTLAAVDGSSVVLADSGGMLLGAHRAARVRVEAGRPAAVSWAGPIELAAIPRGLAREVVRARREARGHGGAGLPHLSESAALDWLRTQAEIEACEAALDELGDGDVLLLDGPLEARPGLPGVDALLAKADRVGVHVVGVCKSTGLEIGGAPALVACQIAARAGPHAPWMARVQVPGQGRSHVVVACLSRAEPRPFRFDVHARGGTGDAARVLAALRAAASHPAYPGYPAPLAMAHNAALLDESARRRLLAEVRDAALAAGLHPAHWDAAFGDYHDVLELGA